MASKALIEEDVLMHTKRLFVVVSTGQSIANLPPILEHAHAEDLVLWIESDVARKNGWSAGARSVLKEYGLKMLPDVQVNQVNDPGQLARACRNAINQINLANVELFIVLNGGNKLTPVGLIQAWAEHKPVLLYGDDMPASCWTFRGGVESTPEIRPYVKHKLDLPQILETSGHRIMSSSEGGRFWAKDLPDEVVKERYGLDRDYCRQLHGQHHHNALIGRTNRSGLPTFDAASRLVQSQQLTKWKASIRIDASAIIADSNALEPYARAYNASLKLARNAANAKIHEGTAELERLGDAFERAVIRRTHAWLCAAQHSGIQSAWRQVKIEHQNRPGIAAAEFDVLLVLKNGVLWHLECKSFQAVSKDLDARLLNLQQAGSRIARMAVCGPLLTDCVSEEWFAFQHTLSALCKGPGRPPFIPFTLDNQPRHYQAPNGSEVECPTFEEVLTRLLAPYGNG